jgi:hypothetical protein
MRYAAFLFATMEPGQMRRLLALAALFFAFAVHAALAQAPDRGYGGPATVGPNFSTGKQSAPPDYGVGKPKKKSAQPNYKKKSPAKTAKPSYGSKKPSKVAKPKKPKSDDVAKSAPREDDTQDKAEDKTADKIKDENETADVAEKTVDKAETCRKFVPATGTTIEVECQ